MSSRKKRDDIRVTIGDRNTNLNVGKNNYQSIHDETKERVTEADLVVVQEIFADLKDLVKSQVSSDLQDSAVERVEELEEAVTSPEPDLTTMEYVKKWFGRNLPKLSGAVTSVLVNPIVGKVVEAGGEIAAEEVRRRFGKGSS